MSSTLKIESLVGGNPVEILQIDGGMFTVGREPENNIVVDSDSVSRKHGCFFEVHGNWFYRDFESTNGSWINGVKVTSGQIRLIRDGDLIQVANFPMRISEVLDSLKYSGALDGIPRPKNKNNLSLLVFSGDRFETEFPLITAGSTFVVGGSEAHVFVDGVPKEIKLLEFVFNGSCLELTTFGHEVPVVINGLLVGGTALLADRDEIDIGQLKVIVNDAVSSRQVKELKSNSLADSNGLNIQAMSVNEMPSSLSPEISKHVAENESLPGSNSDNGMYAQTAKMQAYTGKSEAGDWRSASPRKKEMTGRKFIFGSTPEDEDMMGTVALSSKDFQSGSVFDMSSSQRFAAVQPRANANTGGKNEKLVVFFGVVVFLLLIAGAIFFYYSL